MPSFVYSCGGKTWKYVTTFHGKFVNILNFWMYLTLAVLALKTLYLSITVLAAVLTTTTKALESSHQNVSGS